MKTIGQSQNKVDFMNLKMTYQHFLQVIKNLLEGDVDIANRQEQKRKQLRRETTYTERRIE